MSANNSFFLSVIGFRFCGSTKARKAYLQRRFGLRKEDTAHASSPFGLLIRYGHRRLGPMGLIAANAAYALPGLLVLAAADAAVFAALAWAGLSVRILAAAFCVWEYALPPKGNGLKLLYIALALAMNFHWSITYFFLTTYENLWALLG